MHGQTLSTNRSRLVPRVRQIQSRWSADERRQRAEEGRRRTRELYRLITDFPGEPEIWAVGAPAGEDVRRLAG